MIVDSIGNVIEGTPDYALGRLVEENGVLTYFTFDECPVGEGRAGAAGEQKPPEDTGIDPLAVATEARPMALDNAEAIVAIYEEMGA